MAPKVFWNAIIIIILDQVIVEKLLDYLRTASEDGQKAEVAKRIGELAERFAPDTQWFIDTMNKVPTVSLLDIKAINWQAGSSE